MEKQIKSRIIILQKYDEGEDVMSKAVTHQEFAQLNRAKKKKSGINRSRILQLYSIGLIPMLIVVITKYVPMFGIIVGFKQYRYDKGIFGSDWVGFQNFEFFFKSSDFTRITSNTLIMNFIFIALNLVTSVGLALLMYELISRLKTKIYMTILITPHFLSWVVVSYMAYAFLEPSYGIVNNLIESMGGDRISWYTEPSYWPVILAIFYVWKNVGYNSIVYYAALMGIDESLIEAAKIDGANKWQCTRHIIIPCLLPLIVIMTILAIGGIFHSDFGLFYQIPRNVGKLYETTDVIDTYVFRTMRVVGDMGTSSAVGLVQSIVGLILVLTTNKISKMIDNDFGLI